MICESQCDSTPLVYLVVGSQVVGSEPAIPKSIWNSIVYQTHTVSNAKEHNGRARYLTHESQLTIWLAGGGRYFEAKVESALG